MITQTNYKIPAKSTRSTNADALLVIFRPFNVVYSIRKDDREDFDVQNENQIWGLNIILI